MLSNQPAASPAPGGGVDIEAWTQSTVNAMHGLQLADPPAPGPSPSAMRGTAVTLDIPLDAETPSRAKTTGQPQEQDNAATPEYPIYRPPREPRRRDSLKRREALLKGKEGSRRRQKWENDRLIGNPWAEPPEPHDWEPCPTYPVQQVPYFLAPLWDERRARAELRAADERARLHQARQAQEQLPRPLREKLRRARGARNLLQELEEQVRDFVRAEAARRPGSSGSYDKLETSDSEEEEIVFVGRRGNARASAPPRETGGQRSESIPLEEEEERMVFDALENDKAGTFGRWLVHELANYYDLDTWSVTRGNPRRREAYIGRKIESPKRACLQSQTGMPKPLYGMV